MHLNLPPEKNLAGITFVTSGLGGMSGAQAKAAVISGAACIVAEMNEHAAIKRHQQGWLTHISNDVDESIDLMVSAASKGEPISIGHIGNIVELWERIVERDVNVDLGSDQTSLHNPYQGGYFPADYTYEESTKMMSDMPKKFEQEIQKTLIRHANAINTLSSRGMFFWDYGNAFLLEASRVGADVLNEDGSFRYPSYVEDIMGPICFDYGFGPYRWVCTSGNPDDLATTDAIARSVLLELANESKPTIRQQLTDNIRWIEQAGKNQLVVGSQARILYANDVGRRKIALAMNDAIASGKISGPIVLGRDHHDVSGTDSPYRETANIKDGSMFTADMAVQNFVGDSFRGATWISLHNGGGVGWGEVINGGFGMLIDGSMESAEKIESMLHWDVNNGVARRAWARNSGAIEAIKDAMDENPLLNVTIPNLTDDAIFDNLLR
jgi:urocanate hydratase